MINLIYICKICEEKFYSSSLLANHYRWKHNKLLSVKCKKCGKIIKDKSGIKIHERYCNTHKKITPFICPVCEYKIHSSHKKHLEVCNGLGPRRLQPKRGRHSWNKGLTKETDKRLIKTSNSLKKRWKKEPWNNKFILTNKQRENLSKKQRERIKNGGKIGCGHAMKYWYESPIAGKVSLDGTWELRTAIFFDSSELEWIRNIKKFIYINEKGEKSTYTPDFYVKNWNTYIEIKGWKNKNDELKWKQFTENIEVWDKEKLKEYGILP